MMAEKLGGVAPRQPAEEAAPEDWHAYDRQLAALSFQASHLQHSDVEGVPWEDALRELLEQTITAINLRRLEGGECEPLPDMRVTVGGLHGAFHVVTYRGDNPAEILISSDQPVWDVVTCIITAIRNHCLPGRQRETICICR